MTDQIPADKVKKVADWLWEDILANGGLDEEVAPQLAARTEMAEEVRRILLALLPTPPRPTLADMTLDEQAECTGMQADLAQGDRVVILDGTPGHDGRVQVLESSLDVYCPVAALVTPRPDLPRMAWPGDTPAPAPIAPEDYPPPVRVGDTIESADDPRLATLPTGSALLDCDGEAVAKRGEVWVGDGYIPVPEEGGEFGPWTVLHISKGVDW